MRELNFNAMRHIASHLQCRGQIIHQIIKYYVKAYANGSEDVTIGQCWKSNTIKNFLKRTLNKPDKLRTFDR